MAPNSYDRILVIVALESEAQPIRARLGVEISQPERLHPGFPATIWIDEDDRLAVVTNGQDERFSVDSIATQPAVTSTLHGIERFRPELVISAGTAGGFRSRGGAIGDVIVADRVVYHDRRIDIPGFDRYGIGDYSVADLTAAASRLGLQMGTVSTGNSLDAPPVDIASMAASATRAKDMEAAAVAWVCERLGVPFTAVKAITDLVDDPEATVEQFLRNLEQATERLAEGLADILSSLSGEPGRAL